MHNNDLIPSPPRQPVMPRRALYRLLTPLLIAFVYLIGITCPTQAESIFESRARMMHVADQYIHYRYDQRFEVTVDFGYTDSSLRVARCEQALQAFFPTNMQNVIASRVGIHCPQPNWQVFIPVHIRAYTQVLIASHPLARDTVISNADITRGNREISQYRSGVFFEKQKLVGMVLTQPLTAGSVFTSRQLAPRHALRRSNPANSMIRTGDMTERVPDEVLAEDRRGQKINIDSDHKVTADAMAASPTRIKM